LFLCEECSRRIGRAAARPEEKPQAPAISVRACSTQLSRAIAAVEFEVGVQFLDFRWGHLGQLP